jgi:hypothetical protein
LKDPKIVAEHFASSHGREPRSYMPFSPVVYILENVLPVVHFGQDAGWAPNPRVQSQPQSDWRRFCPQLSYKWLSSLRWFLIVLGWVLAGILAGVVANLFKP